MVDFAELKRALSVVDSMRPKREKANGPAATGGSLFDATGRRVIRHDPGQLPAIVDAVEIALSESPEQNAFRYANQLARVYQADAPDDKNIKRPAGTLIVHHIEAALLQELACRAATHEKFDSRANSYKVFDCPRRVAEAFLARGHWPKIPILTGFIETPTISADGRIIDQPGYDFETGLFSALLDTPGYKRPPAKPTKQEAQAAADRLLNLIETFPFVADADRAAMLAGLISCIQRRLLPSAPIFCITAPSAGTGKTLLAETLALVTTARRASVISLGPDDSEFEKRLTGVALAGDSLICVDNVERPVRGDLICQLASQQIVRLRPLGGSVMRSVPSNSSIVATGNNLSVIGDLKRRVVMIRLDAKLERPERRAFDRDHLATVSERRGEIITDCLTIVAAYLAAGKPKIEGLHVFGGFEHWDSMVRRPLVWLGLADPLLTCEDLREQDPDLEGMRLLFNAWFENFGETPTRGSDVLAAALATRLHPGDGDYFVNPDLRDAIQIICAEKLTSRRLGGWLRAHRDRIVDGFHLEHGGTDGHDKVVRWRLVKCG